jgi:tol-pal system protein YbgF
MKNTVLIILSYMTVLCGCALQRDLVALDHRLILTEQHHSESEKKLRNQSAGQHVMIDRLKEEIQILRGKLEEIEYTLNKKIKTDKDRIVRLEQYLNLEPTGSELKIVADSGIKPKSRARKKLSENEIYQQAKQAFDQGDFETAREGFQKLIKQYPKSKHADNAQFWIGEIYYREKWYEKAIIEYQEVIEKYPKGNKVPASLLKQGFAFYNLGDKANARLILTELLKKYPESNESKIARQKLKGFTP